MKRDPALHITKSALKEVLTVAGFKVSENDLMAIFKAAKPHQIRNRTNIIAKAATAKKIQKTQETDSPSVGIFQRILVAIRMEQKHTYVQQIKPNDTQWIMLKEVAQSACEFCETFELGRDQGFKTFIEIGLKILGRKYALNKFKFHKEKIFTTYDSIRLIKQDKDADGTEMLYRVWLECMDKYAGFSKMIEKNNPDYVHLVYAREAADEEEADFEDWVEAQFAGLTFVAAIPELSQFYGENAAKRYQKYMMSVVKEPVKDGLPVEFESDAEERYYKALRGQK